MCWLFRFQICIFWRKILVRLRVSPGWKIYQFLWEHIEVLAAKLDVNPRFSIVGGDRGTDSLKKKKTKKKTETVINTCVVSLIKQQWENMSEMPQKRDFLTWSMQNFLRKRIQFVRKYPITWLIDLANILHDVNKFIDFILCHVIKNCLVLFRNFVNKPAMWLFSLNTFEENQFYGIKKRNI